MNLLNKVWIILKQTQIDLYYVTFKIFNDLVEFENPLRPLDIFVNNKTHLETLIHS